jgi:thioredoxin-related protein
MKRAICWLAAILAWALQPALAADGVPLARDLHKDGELARDKNAVLLVMFSRPNCTYCRTVLNDFLIPMNGNADYQAKVVMRRIDNSSSARIHDFDGHALSSAAFARRHGVNLVPTVMVFSAEGKPLAKPLVGLTTVDYYGYYLDQIIDQGLTQVRVPTPVALSAP